MVGAVDSPGRLRACWVPIEDGEALGTAEQGPTYRPTDRNGLVASLLADHGFDPVAGDTGDDGARLHVLPADRSIEVPAHITVVEP